MWWKLGAITIFTGISYCFIASGDATNDLWRSKFWHTDPQLSLIVGWIIFAMFSNLGPCSIAIEYQSFGSPTLIKLNDIKSPSSVCHGKALPGPPMYKKGFVIPLPLKPQSWSIGVTFLMVQGNSVPLSFNCPLMLLKYNGLLDLAKDQKCLSASQMMSGLQIVSLNIVPRVSMVSLCSLWRSPTHTCRENHCTL